MSDRERETPRWQQEPPQAEMPEDAPQRDVPEDERDRVVHALREELERAQATIIKQNDQIIALMTEASLIADVVRATNDVDVNAFQPEDKAIIIDEESPYFKQLGAIQNPVDNDGMVTVELANGLRRNFHIGTHDDAQIKLLGKNDGTNATITDGSGNHYEVFGIPGLELNPGDAVKVNRQSMQIIGKTNIKRVGLTAMVTQVLDDETLEVQCGQQTKIVLTGPPRFEDQEGNVVTPEQQVAPEAQPVGVAERFGATTVTAAEVQQQFPEANPYADQDTETAPEDAGAVQEQATEQQPEGEQPEGEQPEGEQPEQPEGEQPVDGQVLQEVEIKVGDLLMLDRGGTVVLRHIPREDSGHRLDEAIRITFNDIAGLNEAKEACREAIAYPITRAALYEHFGKKPPKGMLFYGKPGNGKTMLGKAITNMLAEMHGEDAISSGFIYVKGPELLSKWVGNTEAAIRALFARGEDHYKRKGYPAILFIDEAESILPQRGRHQGSFDIADTAVPMFLSLMDGLEENHVLVVLATNRPGLLDPAAIREGRCDKHIKVESPTINTATDYFVIHLRPVPLDGQPEKSDDEYKMMRKKLMTQAAARATAEVFSNNRTLYTITDGKTNKNFQFCLGNICSGSLIKGVVDEATSIAMRRNIEAPEGTPPSGVGVPDLCDAVERLYRRHLDQNHNFDLEEFCDENGIERRSASIKKNPGDYEWAYQEDE